ncbi:MAG: NAD(P)-dependent oxidoreductase [Pseudomonadota bacterium]
MIAARPLAGRTMFLSGGSRGIGLSIAKTCAAAGANVAVAAKTADPHPKLPGTIHTAAEEIAAMGGGEALPLVLDIRDPDAVDAAVAATVERFGGIDLCVNNASAIQLTTTLATEVKRFDLMMSINARGTFVVTRACLPHLLKSDHARVLTLSPPLDFAPHWFKNHAAYSLAKYGMSVLSLGWAAELAGKVGVNCLWPRTTIDTAAVRNLLGGDSMAAASRTGEVMGDAALAILTRDVGFSGWFCLDDLVLADAGVRDFSGYAVTPGATLQPDFFVPAGAPEPDAADGRVGWRGPTLSEADMRDA